MREKLLYEDAAYPLDLKSDSGCPPFSLILPVYNEEDGIIATLDHLQQTLQFTDCIYEIIAVNDGSTDNTSRILLTRSDITVIHHRRNRGYGAALKTGIRHAKYPLQVSINCHHRC